jgi:hypothetical protein
VGTEADCDCLPNRVVAHPANGCGSNNNGEEQETTCKKVTGDNPWRQPGFPMKNTSSFDMVRGRKRNDQMLSALTPWMPGN